MENSKISDLARIAHSAYNREWAAKNPEKRKASNERYWRKRALAAITQDNERRAKQATEHISEVKT